jgi:hypothetical protein
MGLLQESTKLATKTVPIPLSTLFINRVILYLLV